MAVLLKEAPREHVRRRGPGVLGVLLGLFAVVATAGIVVVLGLLAGILQFGNPFAAQTIDRTPPAVLRRLESLSSYRAASANFEVNVDLEERHRFIPTFLAGERTTYLAVGNVDAVVDFDHIDAEHVVRRDDGSVVVTLPHARRLDAVVDADESRITSRDRGLADRVGSAFVDTPTSDRELVRLAEKKMDKAAAHSGVVAKAERNTTKMLDELLGRLGYGDVTVRFVDPHPAAPPATGAGGQHEAPKAA